MKRYFADRFDEDGLYYVFDSLRDGQQVAGPWHAPEPAHLWADGLNVGDVPSAGVGSIAVTEKIRGLVERAPAGGVFHGATLTEAAGGDFGGFVDLAGFTVTLRNGEKYSVRVERG